MKLRMLSTAVCFFIVGLVTTSTLKAQTPPASTYNPGNWQPVARVASPKAPIELQLVNKTGLTLEYGLTDLGFTGKLPPGSSTVRKGVILPDFLLINAMEPLVRLNYDVTVNGNIVTVAIRQAGSGAGDTTINLQQTGGIYVY
ncbi:hypothetical protein [Scytonema sp. NUACC26]|uniref:hypothetical protein n=1 Tax=Scytonema sp. NUACC26 TaxID=3140176 RepID=UPI0034DC7A63